MMVYKDMNRSFSGGHGPPSTARQRREWLCSLLSLVGLLMVLPWAATAARQQQQSHRLRHQKHPGKPPAILRPGRRRVQDGTNACTLCPNDGNLMCIGPTWGDQCNQCASGKNCWPCNLPDECVCQDSYGNVAAPDDLINPNTDEDRDELSPVAPLTESPSKHPTIVVPEDEPEIVPIRFDVNGLPQNDAISMELLGKELRLVTTRVILQLAKSIQGLKILKVEERTGGITNNSFGGNKPIGPAALPPKDRQTQLFSLLFM
jgi:hypothetical protein